MCSFWCNPHGTQFNFILKVYNKATNTRVKKGAVSIHKHVSCPRKVLCLIKENYFVAAFKDMTSDKEKSFHDVTIFPFHSNVSLLSSKSMIISSSILSTKASSWCSSSFYTKYMMLGKYCSSLYQVPITTLILHP